ncbi:MAG: 5'/3'-nucleotidase SurE [Rikenellaceae bacterium]|nr:5'/3'-nucleotidase SurE [Rikenellaceae bacterium]MCL2692885.1 5'/3'-nucleotidase SurE [Rikenellaceae bacterium]
MGKPLIFITNDDGYSARGLAALIEIGRKFGNVVVIAPEQPQSGKSHSITMYNPLYLRTIRKEEGLEVYACSGTPADCVKLAFDHLLADRLPDLTLSGINHGSNSAISVLYSGTMGAAIEASFYGRPSIGFSLTDHSADADFRAASAIAETVVAKTLASNIEMPMCLNINIPVGTPEQIRGVRVVRQNEGYWKETFVRRQDPRGNDYYWLTGDFYNAEPGATDTDEWALDNMYVSVVPIQVDMTNHRQVATLGAIFNE